MDDGRETRLARLGQARARLSLKTSRQIHATVILRPRRRTVSDAILTGAEGRAAHHAPRVIPCDAAASRIRRSMQATFCAE
jgi:hypothetical protein